jgi:hypothetical protein
MGKDSTTEEYQIYPEISPGLQELMEISPSPVKVEK